MDDRLWEFYSKDVPLIKNQSIRCLDNMHSIFTFFNTVRLFRAFTHINWKCTYYSRENSRDIPTMTSLLVTIGGGLHSWAPTGRGKGGGHLTPMEKS